MISLAKKKWTEIFQDYCQEIYNNDLLSAISNIYKNIDEAKKYAYVVEMGFGDFIIKNGIINDEILISNDNYEFKKDIAYSEDPLALVVENQIEVFTINKCSNRTRIVKEYTSEDKKAHILDEKEYTVPLNTITKGDFYGVFGTLDFLVDDSQPDHGMDWYAISGQISFQFDFPFFHSQVKKGIKEEYKNYFRQNKDYTYDGMYFPGKEQIDLIKYVLPDFKTTVIYFPKHIFETTNTILKKELHLHILKKGWSQCVPLRHNSFEKKVLTDILKNISLNNNTEFILRLYDYLRNVIRGRTSVLRPLMNNENHFLNEALINFQSDCYNYFNTEKKHIKPVIYVYDLLEKNKYGILSMNNLPILKNYNYTKLNDVLEDLRTVSKEFERNDIKNYILDIKSLDGYGQLDHYGRGNEMIIKGTKEFRKLISEITSIDIDRLKTTYGHFSNAIAIKLNIMFPRYYVLEQLLEKHKIESSLKDYFIISVQHLMRSTGSLFETLLRWGIEPEHIFLTGKIYSAHDETIEKIRQLGINIKSPTIPNRLGYYADFLEKDVLDLWRQLRHILTPNAKIIILDDGGFVLKNVPDDILQKHPVFGIEQTTSGIRLQNSFKKFPVIHVAASAAKTIIEPPIVSEAVKIQLGNIIEELKPKILGIIGFGYIGKAIAQEFCNEYNITVFDIDNTANRIADNGFNFSDSAENLYQKSDVIISATGKDISDIKWLQNSNGDKTLISVSSGDIEFNTLIRNCTPYLVEEFNSPLQDLNLKTSKGNSLKILRGGLVANFTGKPDSSPGHIIQMTRGLLFSAIIQIVEDNDILQHQTGAVVLDPQLQQEVVNLWFHDQSERKMVYGDELSLNFQDMDWIEGHSKK